MANALKTLFTDIATAIRETLPDVGKMSPNSFPDRIREVAQAGGGSSDLVKYVTFMSWDGTTELFKMPVLSGDDCKDPVVHGDIETPTKESTNTQNFTYSGWALTSGESANTSALKNVTEDRVVYVSFTASVRYYTVNFYDDTTLLKTVQVTYGADASALCKPTKAGYIFKNWNPSVSNVTSDIDTYAVWEKGVAFATSTWEDIIDAINKGNISSFAIGDTRTETMTLFSSSRTVKLKIIGINHDDLADGSGKASLSILGWDNSGDTVGWTLAGSYSNTSKWVWSTCNYRTCLINSVLPKLPELVRANIKQVNKAYCKKDNTTIDYSADEIWLPSATELGLGSNVAGNPAEGEKYDAYVGGKAKSTAYNDLKISSNKAYATRSRNTSSIGYSWNVNSSYMLAIDSSDTTPTNGNVVVFGFCL